MRGSTAARMREVNAIAAAAKKAKTAAGIAYAREWRIRNKPYFDAIYGPEVSA